MKSNQPSVLYEDDDDNTNNNNDDNNNDDNNDNNGDDDDDDSDGVEFGIYQIQGTHRHTQRDRQTNKVAE